MSIDELEQAMRAHPHGCVSKFLNGRHDRLRRELERSWEKAEELIPDQPEAEPTYPAETDLDVTAARAVLDDRLEAFRDTARDHYAKGGHASVHAIMASTGIGKSRSVARLIAHIRKNGPRDCPLVTKPWGFSVPRHALGDEIALDFMRYGLRAQVWRGREADDPDQEGKQMCLDLDAVKTARLLGESVSTSVCKGTGPDGQPAECPFYQQCAYQRQEGPAGRLDLRAPDALAPASRVRPVRRRHRRRILALRHPGAHHDYPGRAAPRPGPDEQHLGLSLR